MSSVQGPATQAYFLARDGKNSGPFTRDQIDEMRKSGELLTFQWMWDPSAGNWSPLGAPVAPPSPPSSSGQSTQVKVPEFRQPSRREKPIATGRRIEAVCHDNRAVVSGVIETMTESGCELLVEDPEAGQAFSERSPLQLNLLDPKTGETTNVSAHFEGMARREGRWAYRLSWTSCPDMLAA